MVVELDSRSEEAARHTNPPHTVLAQYDLWPVLASLVSSAAIIIRSASTLNGHRAYLLFDDAAISLTYARNLANGHGLVWIAGQHPVEGYSNFLWTLWMAAIEWAHPTAAMAGLWVMLSGATLLAANTYLVCRIARRLLPDSWLAPLLAGLATAFYFALAQWTIVGMETGLVAFLSSGAILCVLQWNDAARSTASATRVLLFAGVLLALDSLTRDDTFLVAVVVGVFVYVHSERKMRPLFVLATPLILAIVGHLLFRIAYYGYPFPNTYYLKTSAHIADDPRRSRSRRRFCSKRPCSSLYQSSLRSRT